MAFAAHVWQLNRLASSSRGTRPWLRRSMRRAAMVTRPQPLQLTLASRRVRHGNRYCLLIRASQISACDDGAPDFDAIPFPQRTTGYL